MTAPFLFQPLFRQFDNSGIPAAGYQLYTYAAGSTTPKTTYSDAAGTVPNTNPVVLDTTGSAVVRLATGTYNFVLKDPTGVTTIWSVDNYESPYLAALDIGTALYPQTAAETAASVVPSNYVYPTLPFADVRRYGCKCDGTTDDTTAFGVALTVTATLGLALIIPYGYTLKITSYVQLLSNTTLYILGKLQLTNRASGLFANGGSNISIYGNKIGQVTDTTVASSYVWNPVTTVDAPAIHLRSVTNCIVDGLNMTYVCAGIYVTNTTTNTATPGGAFVLGQASPVNVVLSNNNISFTEYGALSSYQSVNLKYDHNYVYRCGDGGIWMLGCIDSEITNNTRVSPTTVPADVVTYGQNIQAHPTTWNDEQGIELENCQNCLVADNIVTQFWGFGISAANGSNRCIIARNRVSYCENAGIITRDGDAIKNANMKVTIIGNTITNNGTPQFNALSGAGTGAIRTGETYICEIIDNTIYGYQTYLGINAFGPGTYQAGQYAGNPHQASLTIRGNSVLFKNAFQEQDAIPEYQFTTTTPGAINIDGQYDSVLCDENHIRTDRYTGGDTRFNSSAAITLTYFSVNSTFYPTACSIDNNTIVGWGYYGVFAAGQGAMTGSGLSVSGNKISQNANSAIVVNQTNGAVITRNNINQVGSAGGYPAMLISGINGTPITSVNASGNVMVGGFNTGGNAMTYGVSLSYATDIDLSSNRILNPATAPIQLNTGVTGNIWTASTTGFPRSGAGSPVGSLFSYYTGEPYLATGSTTWYFATAGNATTWNT